MAFSSTIYIFVDPFAATSSGVSVYTRFAVERLRLLGVPSVVIGRYKSESLELFRRRIASEVIQWALKGNRLIVEAPESLAATCYVPKGIYLHIRLHCSRSLGALMQGDRYEPSDVAKEQTEINRATYISAPSQAAVAASKLLFELNSTLVIYPNPTYSSLDSMADAVDEGYVLFVGRYQRLKGIHFLIEIAKRLSDIKFVLACPNDEIKNERLPSNINLIDGEVFDKSYVMARAKLILLPSLFETASMVGMEAIALGTPVVTWDHIPLNEYWSAPWVNSVPYGNVVEMSIVVRKLVNSDKPKRKDEIVGLINKDFDMCITGVINGVLCNPSYLRPLSGQVMNVIVNLPTNEVIKMGSGNSFWQRFKKKYRKLKRDPAKFFGDSSGIDGAIYRYLSKPKVSNAINDKGSNPIPDKYIDDSNTEVTEKADNEAVSDGRPLSIPIKLKLGEIGRSGKVTLKDPASAPQGWLTAICYAEIDLDLINNIQQGIASFSDFAPFKNSSLMYIGTNVDEAELPISILNRIDLKNKERLACIDNIIVFDVAPNFIEAIRSCGTRQRIVLFLTGRVSFDYESAIPYIDALICLGQNDALHFNWRRKNIIHSIDQFPIMLRKVLQEIGPKSPDMLLPLIGGNNYEPSLLYFDSSRYQGLIRIKSGVTSRCSSLNQYISDFSGQIVEFFVLDSIYMRYRSLCEAVEKGASPAELIELCLYDGVLFDVH